MAADDIDSYRTPCPSLLYLITCVAMDCVGCVMHKGPGGPVGQRDLWQRAAVYLLYLVYFYTPPTLCTRAPKPCYATISHNTHSDCLLYLGLSTYCTSVAGVLYSSCRVLGNIRLCDMDCASFLGGMDKIQYLVENPDSNKH